jgi:UDP-N-acetylglucosamine 1-carboxyvinyltransferase
VAEETLSLVGPAFLKGEVTVSGSKNLALPLLATVPLFSSKFVFCNVPNILDVHIMLRTLSSMGIDFSWRGNTLELECCKLRYVDLISPALSELRASFLFVASFLSRFGHAVIKKPGGDQIGDRPVDIHLEGLKSLGYEANFEGDVIRFRRVRQVSDAEFVLKYPSVGATEQLIIASVVGSGRKVFRNIATEPEVKHLISWLSSCGGKINLYPEQRVVEIESVPFLSAQQAFFVPGDRIEGITWILAGLLCGNDEIVVKGVHHEDLNNVSGLFKSLGVQFQEDKIISKRLNDFANLNIVAEPYPGFPTDAQPMMAVLLSQGLGVGKIKDNVFPNRFAYLSELSKLGLKFESKEDTTIIVGPQKLTGNEVVARDIRAGIALVLAGLIASGTTSIKQVNHLRRGYELLEAKLLSLGAKVLSDQSLEYVF